MRISDDSSLPTMNVSVNVFFWLQLIRNTDEDKLKKMDGSNRRVLFIVTTRITVTHIFDTPTAVDCSTEICFYSLVNFISDLSECHVFVINHLTQTVK